MKVVTAVVAGCQGVAEQARRERRQVGERPTPEARLDHPPHEVAPAHAARRPWASAAREDDLAPSLMELFRQLASSLAAAHDQDGAWRKLRRVAIFLGEQLCHTGREIAGAGRHESALIPAGCDHHTPSSELARASLQREAAGLGVERGHGAALAYGRIESARPPLEVLDELISVHEAIGIRPCIRRARQLDRPVRCDQAERVPAPRPPRLRDTLRLQDDVVHSCLLQVPARRESRLPRADDGDVHAV